MSTFSPVYKSYTSDIPPQKCTNVQMLRFPPSGVFVKMLTIMDGP